MIDFSFLLLFEVQCFKNNFTKNNNNNIFCVISWRS